MELKVFILMQLEDENLEGTLLHSNLYTGDSIEKEIDKLFEQAQISLAQKKELIRRGLNLEVVPPYDEGSNPS